MGSLRSQYLVPGTWYLDRISKYQVPNTKYRMVTQ